MGVSLYNKHISNGILGCCLVSPGDNRKRKRKKTRKSNGEPINLAQVDLSNLLCLSKRRFAHELGNVA